MKGFVDFTGAQVNQKCIFYGLKYVTQFISTNVKFLEKIIWLKYLVLLSCI